jgi:hypothetical protein
MRSHFKFWSPSALVFCAILMNWTSLHAQTLGACHPHGAVKVRVDQGHPWRPPFGLERVGARPVAHVELDAQNEPQGSYYMTAYQNGHAERRYPLAFQRNRSLYEGKGFAPTVQSPFYARVELTSIPSALVVEVECEGTRQEVARQTIRWPQVEADAVAGPDRTTNPVDLGAILPPHDWLLLTPGQTAVIRVAALSRARDVPQAKLRAWFEGSEPIEAALPLVSQQRATKELRIQLRATSERSTLHVVLSDGHRELWQKRIPTMNVSSTPQWPSFGVVETKLRYDAPILATDPATGEHLPSVDYQTAWDPKFKDVVVFLPNGSRFVFWRGSNYIPFWAGRYNTGVLYQWAENCSDQKRVAHPDGSFDCPEPLFDSQLRYSRVRIVESTASRIHVRWDYRLTDVEYKAFGGTAVEDFYFYPDGFGTRVVTVPSVPEDSYQLSEFIIMTPQGAYPFEVLPTQMIEALGLEGGKERVTFPHEPTMRSTTMVRPNMLTPRERPMVYRLFSHKDDPAAAIYFHPSSPAVPWAFQAFFDQGEIVTPVYWGNHWPLNRGKWTGWGINDQLPFAPSHNSVGGWTPPRDPDTGKWLGASWEVAPLTSGAVTMPDGHGQVSTMNLSSFVWMIAHTDLQDEPLRNWGRSFARPPTIEVAGARLDVPSYSAERRALRLVAESNAIEIQLKPSECTVNPVFEIDEAPQKLIGVRLNGHSLAADAYTWDGAILWIKAMIGAEGGTLLVQFDNAAVRSSASD